MTKFQKILSHDIRKPPLGSLNELECNYYNILVIPWKGYNSSKVKIKYSKQIRMLYSKRVISNDIDFNHIGVYKYFIIDNPNKQFGESITLVNSKYYKGTKMLFDIIGTIFSPIPIYSVDGFVGIMNEDDFILGKPIKYKRDALKSIIKMHDNTATAALFKDRKIHQYIDHLSQYDDCKIIASMTEFFYDHSFIFAKLLQDYFNCGFIGCTGMNGHFVFITNDGNCFDAKGWVESHDLIYAPMHSCISLNDTNIGFDSEAKYKRFIKDINAAGVWPNA